MTKKISIIIPCYNQTRLLERNLEYLRKQTYKDFRIFILDDASSENYQEVLSKFTDLDITYERNKNNLGAMGNIFHSIFYQTDSPYKISLHEDDILHPQYLEKAVKILDENKQVAFVCALAKWFDNDADLAEKYTGVEDIGPATILDKTSFIQKILAGKHIMLSSVVYRDSLQRLSDENTVNIQKYLDMYNVYCDRPFLIDLVDKYSVALIEEKVMFTRDHGEYDTRFKDITEEHCFNLVRFYKDNVDNTVSTNHFSRFSTNFLIYSYSEIIHKKMSAYKFVCTGRRLGFIRLSRINKIGVIGILKIIFGRKIVDKIIRRLKRQSRCQRQE
ncbi:MAG: glycosyltransferase family 2 protein [Candidatus Taylorbacteria bacterium]